MQNEGFSPNGVQHQNLRRRKSLFAAPRGFFGTILIWDQNKGGGPLFLDFGGIIYGIGPQ